MTLLGSDKPSPTIIIFNTIFQLVCPKMNHSPPHAAFTSAKEEDFPSGHCCPESSTLKLLRRGLFNDSSFRITLDFLFSCFAVGIAVSCSHMRQLMADQSSNMWSTVRCTDRLMGGTPLKTFTYGVLLDIQWQHQ